MYLRKSVLPLIVFFVGLTTQKSFGQFESGTILGTVQDPSGAAISSASVTLVNTKTGTELKSATNGSGSYEFVNQHIGSYKVQVSANGFQQTVTEVFDLAVNARQRVDLTLQVGQASQSVNVTGAAEQLETDSSSRGQLVNPKEIVDLPLNGRAYADLTLLVPGAAKSPLENGSDSTRDASFNINGQRSEQNNFLLDGVDNNAYGTSNQGFSNQVIQPNPDALTEFKVEADNYSAEYGRSSGGVINATIKSGTNQFHGVLWEFLRQTDLNATGFFKPVGGVKPAFNQNQFGAAAGGPIVKDKIFLFGDYEGFRRVYHPILFATLPAANWLSGNLGVPIKNPYTGQVYSDGVIPQSQISPFAQAVAAALPAPNLATNANNYESDPADTIHYDKGDVRYDEYFGQKVTFFFRYSQDNEDIFSPAAIPGVAGGSSNGNVFVRNKQGVPGVTWTVNPTSILEVRVGVDYTKAGKNPIALGLPLGAFAVPGLPSDKTVAGGLYTVNLGGGLSALGRQGSNPQFQDPLVVNPKVNYTKILGRHSMKVGFEYQRISTAVSDFHPQYGQDNYTGYFSNPNSTSPAGLQQQEYSWADFLFGARNHYELNNNPVAHLEQRMYFAYLQDDFRVNNKLTLNLGVRYEFATPQWERDNHLANYDPITNATINATSGSLYDRSLVHPWPWNWAPRVGLAYTLNPKTVIRAGYGISYVEFNRLGGENLLAYNGPFSVDAVIDGQTPGEPGGVCTSVSQPAGACFRPASLGFPSNFATPAAFNTATTQVRYIPADDRPGYVQSWHFSIQRQLADNWVLDLGYVGNHGVGLTILADANQASPNIQGQNLKVDARRPIPNFTTIEESYDGGFSSYNSLQVKLERRYSAGLYLLNSFTWSKAIDNAPGHLENYDGDNSRINIRNIGIERGLSSYNQPFNNTTSVIYDLPYGQGRRFHPGNEALDLIAGGWSVSMFNTLTSGLPLNITYSASSQYSASPLVTPRPNLVTGAPEVTPSGQQTTKNYLNAAAFSLPSYTQPFGTTPRNSVRGFPFYEADVSLQKKFNLWSESRYLQFRAEAFNLLNRTNFAPANTTYNTTAFGSVTSTFPARQMQMALKLYF